MKTNFLILTGIVFSILAGCVKNLTPDQIMELNRQGKWQEAARAGQQIIADRDEFPFGQVCQVYHSLIYAKTRLKRQVEARALFNDFTEYKANRPFPAYLLWLDREMENIRLELGIQEIQEVVSARDDLWETADPGSLGMNVVALDEFVRLCRDTGADACLVVYKSRLVAEWYQETSREPLAAPALSVIGILAGILSDQGRIKDIDQPVAGYLSAWDEGYRNRVTLLHLLSMTSGLVDKQKGFFTAPDWNRYVTGLRPANEPGTSWEYSLAGVQLLSPVMEKAAGMPVQDFAREYLFKPLHMNSTWFNEDPAGNASMYSLFTTPRDLAKIGFLVINNGMWQGRQIVSPGWIKKMTSPSQDLNPSFYLLWRKFFIPPGVGDVGSNGSYLAVYPEKELIVIHLQSRPGKQENNQDYQRKASELIMKFLN